MSDFAKKVRATEMLDALRGNRFKVFPESELIALGVPYELRKSTRQTMLKERAAKPFNPDHMPLMTPAAYAYLDHVELARKQSRRAQEWKNENYGPLISLYEEWERKCRCIDDYAKSCAKLWDALTAEERLWFGEKSARSRWAFDFPLEAPAPYRFYPGEETPERQRQIDILEQMLAESEKRDS